MQAIILIFAALMGLAFGSFLNVCIVRLPRGESVVAPPSRCRTCGVRVRPLDNIPVVSWLLLRGRCRHCKACIPVRYLLVEAASALLCVGCAFFLGLSVAGVSMAVFCWLLLGLAVIDAETFLLPDRLTMPGIVLGLVYEAVRGQTIFSGLINGLVGAFAIGGVLLLIRLIYRLLRRREGMGLGDIKLGAMLGAWLGWQLGAVALFLGILGGAVGGLVLVVMKHDQHDLQPAGSRRLPFGTFLAGAGVMTALAGPALLRWYMGFFH